METLKKIDDWLAELEKNFLALLLSFMLIGTFWSVLDRNIFNSGVVWVEEFARYMSVWAAFIGAGLGVKKGVHIGVEAFVMLFSEKIKKFFSIVASISAFTFCISAAYIGFFIFIPQRIANLQLSPAMEIPIWWAYLAVPMGCLFMSLHYITKILTAIFPDHKTDNGDNS